jgi:hypothetical protein
VFHGNEFIAANSSFIRDPAAHMKAQEKPLMDFGYCFCEDVREYLARCQLGPFARGHAMQGLVVLSELIRGELEDSDNDDWVELALELLSIFEAEARKCVSSGFLAGPSDSHAAVCLWKRHRPFLWMAECMALAVEVDSRHPKHLAAWSAVGALVHENDWLKIAGRLEDGALALRQAARAVILLRTGLPGVAGACKWVDAVNQAIPEEVLRMKLPGDLNFFLCQGLIQVIQFWAGTGSRCRVRDAMAAMSLLGPRDVAAKFYLTLWADLLVRQNHVMFPVALPHPWDHAAKNAKPLVEVIKADSLGWSQDIGALYARCSEPLVIHDVACGCCFQENSPAGLCVCGADQAGFTAVCMAEADARNSSLVDNKDMVRAVAQEPLTRALACLPIGSLEFVGALFLVEAGKSSPFQQVLHCVGDHGVKRSEEYDCCFSSVASVSTRSSHSSAVTPSSRGTTSSGSRSTVPCRPCDTPFTCTPSVAATRSCKDPIAPVFCFLCDKFVLGGRRKKDVGVGAGIKMPSDLCMSCFMNIQRGVG